MAEREQADVVDRDEVDRQILAMAWAAELSVLARLMVAAATTLGTLEQLLSGSGDPCARPRLKHRVSGSLR
ncbi:hypothetical protein ABZ912_47820 [Nonomuraea angiospora]|uniref:hypothetical protein n=1 Tax=Nonomuraea angiospora TaxID=46172 RepID=UPI0033D2EA74